MLKIPLTSIFRASLTRFTDFSEPVTARSSTAFSMASQGLQLSANSPAQHSLLTRLGTGAVAASLLSGCDGVAVLSDPFAMAQIAVGASMILGAGALVRSAIVTEPKRIENLKDQVGQIDTIKAKAKSKTERAAFLDTLEGTEAAVEILREMKDEVIDAVANIAKKIESWKDVVSVCDDIVSELRRLNIENEAEISARVLALRQSALDQIKEFQTGVLTRLKEKSQRIPDWIEEQEAKAARLTEEMSLQEQVKDLASRVSKLFGYTEELQRKSDQTASNAEGLISELESIEEDLEHVQALEEVESCLALPDLQGWDQDQLQELERMVRAKEAQRVAIGGGV